MTKNLSNVSDVFLRASRISLYVAILLSSRGSSLTFLNLELSLVLNP